MKETVLETTSPLWTTLPVLLLALFFTGLVGFILQTDRWQ